MSAPPFAPEEAIAQLRRDGYDIELIEGALLVHDVPFVTSTKTVRRVTLGEPLEYAGDLLQPPRDHTILFCGEHPCDAAGNPLTRIVAGPDASSLRSDVIAQFRLSAKPDGGLYRDLHDKVTHYVDLIERWAQVIEPGATAQIFSKEGAPTRGASPFAYADSKGRDIRPKLPPQWAASRSCGLGGTGSFLLDLLIKCPVAKIHVYDGDFLLSHNAFRAPGAVSVDELRARPSKAAYWAGRSLPLHDGVVAHDHYVTVADVPELATFDFVFLAIDDGPARGELVAALQAHHVSFIDVGMGVDRAGSSGQLLAAIRVSVSTPQAPAHVPAGTGEDEYGSNIQIAELNALNAALAVIAWKRINGYYLDAIVGTTSIYTTDDDTIATG